MKVFISWSGEIGLKVGEILKEWIPCVIQGITPYLSAADIDKGARWSTDIAKELESAEFGILCVTRENLHSDWLNFEAGALSKSLDKGKVCPFLLDLKPIDINQSPITQFQMAVLEKAEVYKLFTSMNRQLADDCLDENRLLKSFDLVWPRIEESLNNLINSKEDGDKKSKKNPANDQQAVLEEILALLRSQQMILNNPEKLFPDYIIKMLETSNRRRSRPPLRVFGDYVDAVSRVTNLMDCCKRDDLPEEFIQSISSLLRSSQYIISHYVNIPIEFKDEVNEQLNKKFFLADNEKVHFKYENTIAF